ncbi:MAG: Asp-tRNA(Asn)/Glu-tRNA(Gln) amidotransferase subunit GatB [Clostridia bacterium]
MAKQYETVIGLEVYVELATRTKIFCSCSTEFGGAPNAHTCPVCTGMPGALPVLNRQVVEHAMAIGLAVNCTITRESKFDRKNYFYPDNPQNYQISQLYLPIARDGYVEIETGGGRKRIRIHEMHMEEDAGKLIHDEWDDVSLVDYNRSGVPLVEIVSEPDMRSAEEVIAYLETRRWDDNKETSYAMRSKEDARDYRYFPDPDLVPVMIDEEWLERVKADQPELRSEKLVRYKEEFDIPLSDAEMITSSKRMADIFEETAALCGNPKKTANWLMVETMRLLKEHGMEPMDIAFSPANLAKLIRLADAGTINSSVAKDVFEKVFAEDIDPEQYVEEMGLRTVSDEGALRRVISGVIEDTPQAVSDYRGGKKKALGALVGRTMKAMDGKADTALVGKILKEML